ncbi:diaminopropionate ammonia-lyase family [Sphaerochaeta pleomorpha str. Grapes]|uniref:Diaminopropionate ammonia-lyase family n=1 Tax=Sphaerochaeta pleomorpha (strain ATCC BAA-1885 / DSM 22778 / Grapes) TaxID=158190 RepID=G8QRE0_SPHPG|nr:diaminopropionate ammonia-lyase [Sphaerochaeta pleomorpha]AEV28793.1 diaminopropionate ammonia-lyase family [Sphaerochaeta pleomorpha str. Grapes]
MTDTKQDISWIITNHDVKDVELASKLFSMKNAQTSRRFHKQIPGYKMSPLQGLPHLAAMFGVGGIWTKDESSRLELNSFKVLGGSFALYRYLQSKLGILGEDTPFAYLASDEVKEKVGHITFASATDGNHGRGIAWAAQKLGFKCVIYVHSETTSRRIDAIKSNGATVVVVDGNYDDAVRQVAIDAEKNGWTIISDTSWDNYTEIPTWIMQGYLTLLAEAQEQFSGQGIVKPTHVFVQAGVGALAASVVGFYHALFGQDAPTCIIVEPDKAPCLFESAKANDGKPHTVTGALDTIMAGLACGDPSPMAWDILKEDADAFVQVPDYIAAKGMRMYATPLKGDPFIISGESGAVTLGAFASIMQEERLSGLRKALHIDENSQILFINTEGNTDPVHFRQVIWEGANPVPKEYWINR